VGDRERGGNRVGKDDIAAVINYRGLFIENLVTGTPKLPISQNLRQTPEALTKEKYVPSNLVQAKLVCERLSKPGDQ